MSLESRLRRLMRCFEMMFEWSKGSGGWKMSLVDGAHEILSAARLGVRWGVIQARMYGLLDDVM